MFSKTADDSVDGFFEDRFGFEFVHSGRSGTRLDGVVIIVVVVVMVMAGFSGIQRVASVATGGRVSRSRTGHPTGLDGSFFDTFRSVDDGISAAAAGTRSGYWPSGLVMLHHWH